MSPELDAAIEIAMAAHGGECDHSGAPCIEHPLRVMASVEGEDAKVVAVLHDVIDRAGVDEEELLAAGISIYCVEAIVALSLHPGEPYAEHIARVVAHPLARRVKIADITENLSECRLAGLDAAARRRIVRRYRRALAQLGS